MPRPPFAVLVLPYCVELDGEVSYAVFRGATAGHAWHALAGHGVHGETPLEAGRREAWRIAAIPPDAAYLALDSRRAIAADDPAGAVADHVFAVRVCLDEIRPRRRLLQHRWVSYEIAQRLLRSATDIDALWELRHRLGRPATCF